MPEEDLTMIEMDELPSCDICQANGKPFVPASYDAKTRQGPWAFMCPLHYRLYGVGRLGTGFGQRLILKAEAESRRRHPAGKGVRQ